MPYHLISVALLGVLIDVLQCKIITIEKPEEMGPQDRVGEQFPVVIFVLGLTSASLP